MEKQLIISISREYGSAGHLVAEKVAKDLGLPLYNRNILDEVIKENGLPAENANHLKNYDEKPKNPLLSRTVRGLSNSVEENLAQMQFDYLVKKADSGESFVVLGRCSETVLAGREGLVTVFITGRREAKIAHVMESYHLSEKDALAKMTRHDKSRRSYHNSHSDFKWGDSRNYDLCISSSTAGVDGTAEVIEKYVELVRH